MPRQVKEQEQGATSKQGRSNSPRFVFLGSTDSYRSAGPDWCLSYTVSEPALVQKEQMDNRKNSDTKMDFLSGHIRPLGSWMRFLAFLSGFGSLEGRTAQRKNLGFFIRAVSAKSSGLIYQSYQGRANMYILRNVYHNSKVLTIVSVRY